MYYTNCMTTLFAVKIIARVLTMLIGFWVVCMWLFYILQAVAWVMLCVSVCSVLLLCSLCACVCVCACVHSCAYVCVYNRKSYLCAVVSLYCHMPLIPAQFYPWMWHHTGRNQSCHAWWGSGHVCHVTLHHTNPVNVRLKWESFGCLISLTFFWRCHVAAHMAG